MTTPNTYDIRREYVALSRIDELKALDCNKYDFSKLIRLCEELNTAYSNTCYHAVGMLLRAILDHVPPLFAFETFRELANNFQGEKSFKQTLLHLENSFRNKADSFLHQLIRKKMSLPTEQQIDFKSDLDKLLGEVVCAVKSRKTMVVSATKRNKPRSSEKNQSRKLQPHTLAFVVAVGAIGAAVTIFFLLHGGRSSLPVKKVTESGIPSLRLKPASNITRKSSEITPRQIMEALDSVPPLQRPDVAKHYRGLQVDWVTELFTARRHQQVVSLSLLYVDTNMDAHVNSMAGVIVLGEMISCEVPYGKYPELNILKEGARIRVKGTIADVEYVITLENVELSFSR